MKLLKSDLFSFLLILIISLLFTLELFSFPGRPANFDSHFHITNIAQFSKIISSGEIPVIWMNNFANYGIPMGIFAHQATNYLGGTINIATNDPTTSYNLLIFLAIFLSGAFLYVFLRFYFKTPASLLGVFIFTFAPYKLFNIYVRGAMPEVFSAIFLPLTLIAIYLFIVKKRFYGLFLLTISIALLTLNHPMMLIVYSSLFIPYLIFLLFTNDYSNLSKIKLLIIPSLAILLGLLICSYYILPLNFEIKYFYYGLIKNHIDKASYLSLQNFFDPRWYYFTNNDILPRGHVVLFGLFDSIIILIGFVYFIYKIIIKRSKENINLLTFLLITSILIIFFTSGFSDIFYQKLFFLNSIQFPWRFLSSLIFIPPMITAFLYQRFPKKAFFVLVVICVAILSFPQLYGKNFNVYPNTNYYFSKVNAHSVLMNTIWTGKSQDYPDKNPQGKIIQGQGEITNQILGNSQRKYEVDAKTNLTIVDHTFYFPGWEVYVDGVKTAIEFQNPDYRGIITYQVPAGKHSILLKFEDTKVRLLGKILSIVSVFAFALFLLFRKRLAKLLKL
jgi:uncharacterized membrane protein